MKIKISIFIAMFAFANIVLFNSQEKTAQAAACDCCVSNHNDTCEACDGHIATDAYNCGTIDPIPYG
jgi:hypothetical protein